MDHSQSTQHDQASSSAPATVGHQVHDRIGAHKKPCHKPHESGATYLNFIFKYWTVIRDEFSNGPVGNTRANRTVAFRFPVVHVHANSTSRICHVWCRSCFIEQPQLSNPAFGKLNHLYHRRIKYTGVRTMPAPRGKSPIFPC